ncbi:Photosystem I reaction center subunit IX [Aphanothece hegewaldii CCALA 016]|uniref:Photosystem I reaction center subunit IX n=1 Tax=Aphanothece hegewaldii CCALA 016 TaxID=2107694 RepID=A0A2T1LXZ9_9CHRO|nr:Photosystem I reaction center subunit IX [Aphanothece hegewaldii]PSF37265.1 Photosystem I reaction center subunit IX [Aphanothece hegewaldii CCALA 016]
MQNNNGLLRYLSLAPVLLTLFLVAIAVLMIYINYFYPDLLFHPMPNQ